MALSPRAVDRLSASGTASALAAALIANSIGAAESLNCSFPVRRT